MRASRIKLTTLLGQHILSNVLYLHLVWRLMRCLDKFRACFSRLEVFCEPCFCARVSDISTSSELRILATFTFILASRSILFRSLLVQAISPRLFTSLYSTGNMYFSKWRALSSDAVRNESNWVAFNGSIAQFNKFDKNHSETYVWREILLILVSCSPLLAGNLEWHKTGVYEEVAL